MQFFFKNKSGKIMKSKLFLVILTITTTCYSMELPSNQKNQQSRNIDPLALLSALEKKSEDKSTTLTNIKLSNYQVTADSFEQISYNTALECAPEKIKNIITCFKDSNKIQNPILLAGPSQAGKSTLAKAMGLIWGNCYFIPTTHLLTKYQHSGGENIKKIIEEIKKLKQRSALIFDEVTCLTDNNNEHSDGYENAMGLLLALDEISKYKHILFIGTTNNATKMPDQLKKRFQRNTVPIEYPTPDTRKKILMGMIKKLKANFIMDNNYINSLIQKTSGWSCKDLLDLLLEAEELAKAEQKNFVNPSISSHHLDKAFNDLTKRVQFLQIGIKQLSEQERLQERAFAEQRAIARRQSEYAAFEAIIPGSSILLQARDNGECTII
jgi:AAA+ superfamily predicted ATPase